MELPQSRPSGTAQAKKATHDFLSLYTRSSLQQDPRPSSHGGFLKTQNFFVSLGEEKNRPNEDKSENIDIEKPPLAVSCPSVLEHQLPGGFGAYNISHIAYSNQRVAKSEEDFIAVAQITNNDGNDENSNCDSYTGNGFILWHESATGNGSTRNELSRSENVLRESRIKVGQWPLDQPSQSSSNRRSSVSPLSSQGHGQKNQSFTDMIKSAKGPGSMAEDEEELNLMKENSSSQKGELRVKVDGKSSDQKANAPRSKHSATEQRRRCKINDRIIAGNNNSVFNLRSILEKDKLNGNNFLDWQRNLRIVLRSENRENVLETPIPVVTDASTVEKIATERRVRKNSVNVICLMLATMETSLQKRFVDMDAYTIIQQLRTMFQTQSRMERYETSKAILESRLEKGKPVGPHVFKMIGLFENMARLGCPYSQELATDIILHSLHDGFNQFRLNFNMQGVNKTLEELLGMLKTAEQNIGTSETKKDVLVIQKGKGFKKTGGGKKRKTMAKGKGKEVANSKAKGAASDTKCFYCNGLGHWKRNCPKYLEDKKNGVVTPSSGTKKK